MSSFQTYLGDIAKKAQQITAKVSTTPTTKTRKQKLSQKDIRILKSLKEKAKNIIPTDKKIDTSFAKLASFGDTFKLQTEKEDYQKALALEMLTKGKIVTNTFGRGWGGGRYLQSSQRFDEMSASGLQGMFMLNYDKLDFGRGYAHGYGGNLTTSAHLISKEKILNLLNQESRQDFLKKQGLTDVGINYIKSIFSDKNLENKIFNYDYGGKKYFRIGTFDSVMNEILSNKNNPYYVSGYSARVNPTTGLEINDATLYAKKFISDYEKNNTTFKNILLYSQKEKQLLDKYSNTLAGLSGVDLSGYNKLITDAKKNLDLFYSNINEYLSKGFTASIGQTAYNHFSVPEYQYISGVNSNELYKYTGWKKNADNYAALAEKGYKSAFDQLAKILGVSSEQFEITQKTQKETVKQITDILESQNIGKKKEATATSRRNALDIATAKDKPIYETTTRKPVFTQRPS